jgi:hypothetical protein
VRALCEGGGLGAATFDEAGPPGHGRRSHSHAPSFALPVESPLENTGRMKTYRPWLGPPPSRASNGADDAFDENIRACASPSAEAAAPER